ncbi:M20/M25/M40 family metallo-hydrolase [Arsenicibacter rosenii]|uniref:Vacuolar membrane protease n=1 Tax=Arsenicibacter rosenii TaxID=1750698 RepID=A0A1S2VG14_9BACT|nr:M20/M25/M40 family metallo-hydrolase [Arsenicibacter rosenii]OIN57360.1 hypothetical protein BLX24_20510 [Arsenicibacter rosenii]
MTRRNPILAAITLFLLLALSCLSIWLVRPPDVVPASAPDTGFSAERAMQHIRRFARQPHAMGTPEHARVRTYLIGQLQTLGLSPMVQDTTVSRGTLIGHVYNIVGRLKGKGSGKAVLLMAHYDSQPNTPGAADDGAGVAAILETVRALRQSPVLQNDIIVLLTDGEEYGLLGAQGFMLHPWAKEVGFVINLEARGNSGPGMTFEISPQNGWVVREFAKAAPVPFASSLMYEVYRALPNDTDFSVFREAGYPGVNSAFIDGFVNYHKLTDTPEALDLRSLQHHGSNTLALAKHFGTIPLTDTKAPDKVFFNPAGSWLIQYPMWVSGALLAIVTVLLCLVILSGHKKQLFSIGQSVGSLFLFLLMPLLTGAFFAGFNWLIAKLLPYTHFFNGVYQSGVFFVGYAGIAIALALFLSRLAIRWVRPFSLVIGVDLIFLLLAATLTWFVPSASFIFLIPLLFALSGTLIVLLTNRHRSSQGMAYAGIFLVCLSPAILMLMPMVHLLFVTFALQLPSASMFVLTLLLGLCFPLLIIIDRSLQWSRVPALPLFFLVSGLSITGFAVYSEQPTDKQPLHSHQFYILNTDTNKAVWASIFPQTNDWNRTFFTQPHMGTLSGFYPNPQTAYLLNAAPAITDAPPTATVLSDITRQSVRTLTLQLTSVRGAAHMEVVLQVPAESDLLSANIRGATIQKDWSGGADGKWLHLYIVGLPTDKSIPLALNLIPKKPVTLRLYDHSIGLPASLIKSPPPAHVIPEQGRNSNVTIIGKTYRF